MTTPCLMGFILGAVDCLQFFIILIIFLIWGGGTFIKWFAEIVKKSQEAQGEPSTSQPYPSMSDRTVNDPVVPHELNQEATTAAARQTPSKEEVLRDVMEMALGIDMGGSKATAKPHSSTNQQSAMAPTPPPAYPQEESAPKKRVIEILEERERAQQRRAKQTSQQQKPFRLMIGSGDLRRAVMMKEILSLPRSKQTLRQSRGR